MEEFLRDPNRGLGFKLKYVDEKLNMKCQVRLRRLDEIPRIPKMKKKKGLRRVYTIEDSDEDTNSAPPKRPMCQIPLQEILEMNTTNSATPRVEINLNEISTNKMLKGDNVMKVVSVSRASSTIFVVEKLSSLSEGEKRTFEAMMSDELDKTSKTPESIRSQAKHSNYNQGYVNEIITLSSDDEDEITAHETFSDAVCQQKDHSYSDICCPANESNADASYRSTKNLNYCDISDLTSKVKSNLTDGTLKEKFTSTLQHSNLKDAIHQSTNTQVSNERTRPVVSSNPTSSLLDVTLILSNNDKCDKTVKDIEPPKQHIQSQSCSADRLNQLIERIKPTRKGTLLTKPKAIHLPYLKRKRDYLTTGGEPVNDLKKSNILCKNPVLNFKSTTTVVHHSSVMIGMRPHCPRKRHCKKMSTRDKICKDQGMQSYTLDVNKSTRNKTSIIHPPVSVARSFPSSSKQSTDQHQVKTQHSVSKTTKTSSEKISVKIKNTKKSRGDKLTADLVIKKQAFAETKEKDPNYFSKSPIKARISNSSDSLNSTTEPSWKMSNDEASKVQATVSALIEASICLEDDTPSVYSKKIVSHAVQLLPKNRKFINNSPLKSLFNQSKPSELLKR